MREKKEKKKKRIVDFMPYNALSCGHYSGFCERIENSENNRILVEAAPQGYYGKVVPNKLYFWGFV